MKAHEPTERVITSPSRMSESSDSSIFCAEEIMDARTNSTGELEYLVKWEGFGDSENTWEPSVKVHLFRDSQPLSLFLQSGNKIHVDQPSAAPRKLEAVYVYNYISFYRQNKRLDVEWESSKTCPCTKGFVSSSQSPNVERMLVVWCALDSAVAAVLGI